MLPSITDASSITMSSLDFLNNYINPAREAAKQKPVRNNEFMRKLEDELDDENLIYRKSVDSRNRPIDTVCLNYDQMMLVGMRESKAVRKSVLAKLKELSAPSPVTERDQLLLMAQTVIKQQEEIKDLEKTKAQINDKRTATIMGKLGNAAKTIKKLEDKLQDVGTYQSLTASKIPARVDTEMKNNVQSWRLLKQLSSDMQLPPKKVKCERYGEVLAYHVDVIELFKSKYL